MSPIVVRVVTVEDRIEHRLDMPAWPESTMIANVLLRDAEPFITLRYPFASIRFANAQALYRLGACDRGTWDATLVEGHVA